MENNKINDERIVLQRRKIQNDAYQILVYCLIFSILIQQFILKAPFSQFAVEFFCIIGTGIYITIRHILAGINIWSSYKHNKKNIIINGLTSGIISLVLIIFLAGERNIFNLVLFFLVFVAIYFIMQLILQYIINKKQKLIDKKLDEDETEE